MAIEAGTRVAQLTETIREKIGEVRLPEAHGWFQTRYHVEIRHHRMWYSLTTRALTISELIIFLEGVLAGGSMWGLARGKRIPIPPVAPLECSYCGGNPCRCEIGNSSYW